MKKKQYTYHSDAGHGWLEVPIIDIELAGISELITAYSYKKGNTAFLEEDCDMTRFLFALKEDGVEVEITDVHDGDESIIRTYGRFGYNY